MDTATDDLAAGYISTMLKLELSTLPPHTSLDPLDLLSNRDYCTSSAYSSQVKAEWG